MVNHLALSDQRIVRCQLPVQTPRSPDHIRTLTDGLTYLLSKDHKSLPGAEQVLDRVLGSLSSEVLQKALSADNENALLELHRTLFLIYETALMNPLSKATIHQNSPWLVTLRFRLETAWLDWEETREDLLLPSEEVARHPAKLMDWIQNIAEDHNPWDKRVANFLAFKANIHHFKQFVLTDAYLNYRFYDILSLASVYYSEQVKAEISRHLWDESGSGNPGRAHTLLFSQVLETLDLELPQTPVWSDWRPYAGYNLHFLFGLQRRYYFRALGSLAVPEIFAPVRDAAVTHGLERLGFNLKKDMNFYHIHRVVDVNHGASWLKNVIGSVVQGQPEAGKELALGATLRMVAFRRYNGYLANLFGLDREEPGQTLH